MTPAGTAETSAPRADDSAAEHLSHSVESVVSPETAEALKKLFGGDKIDEYDPNLNKIENQEALTPEEIAAQQAESSPVSDVPAELLDKIDLDFEPGSREPSLMGKTAPKHLASAALVTVGGKKESKTSSEDTVDAQTSGEKAHPIPRAPERRPEAKQSAESRSPRGHHAPRHARSLHGEVKALLKSQQQRAAKLDQKEVELRERGEAILADMAAEEAAAQKALDDAAKQNVKPEKKNPKATTIPLPESKNGYMVRDKDSLGRYYTAEAATGKRIKTAVYEGIVSRDYEQAVKRNEVFDSNSADLIQTHIEGKLLTDKDPNLGALLRFGKEVSSLVDKKDAPKQDFEDKKRLFALAYATLDKANADQRALDYILNESASAIDKDKAGNFALLTEGYPKIEGSAFVDGQKVTLLDVVLSPDGTQKAYTIEEEDGSIRSVFAQEVEFKRQYPVPEVERSFTEKVKHWFKKEGEKYQEYGGKAWVQGKWHDAKDWLFNRHITETMTEAEIDNQKKINRRNNRLGLAALSLGVGTISVFWGINLHENIAAADAAAAANGFAGGETTADLSNFLPPYEPVDNELKGILDASASEAAQAAADTEAIAREAALQAALENPAYNIPKGGGGIQLFEKLNLSEDVWNSHRVDLVNNFPNVFKIVGNDVQIQQSGWLPTEVRTFIETIKSRS